MYRTFLKYALAAVTAILSAGCSKTAPRQDAMVPVQFSLSVDGAEAYVLKSGMGDGTKVNTCTMELFYDSESIGQYTAPVSDGHVSFSVSVVAGRTYSAAFWAQKDDSYNVESLRNVYFAAEYNVDDDSMDAFCARCIDFPVQQESSSMEVTLKRPFAMVSVSYASGTFSSASFSAPHSYNVLEDSFGTDAAFTYTYPDFYVFAPATKSLKDFNIDGKHIQGVFIQRNYRTNINIH